MKTISNSILSGLANTANNTLHENQVNDRLEISFEGAKVNVQRVTRSDDKNSISKVFILISASKVEAHNYLTGFIHALTF